MSSTTTAAVVVEDSVLPDQTTPVVVTASELRDPDANDWVGVPPVDWKALDKTLQKLPLHEQWKMPPDLLATLWVSGPLNTSATDVVADEWDDLSEKVVSQLSLDDQETDDAVLLSGSELQGVGLLDHESVLSQLEARPDPVLGLRLSDDDATEVATGKSSSLAVSDVTSSANEQSDTMEAWLDHALLTQSTEDQDGEDLDDWLDSVIT